MIKDMDVLLNATVAVVNVAMAVWFIRGGRYKFGPGWTAGWVGYAVLDVVAIWWHAAAWLAIVCGVVAVVARRAAQREQQRQDNESTTRVLAQFFDDLDATPDVPPDPSVALGKAARRARREVGQR